MSLDLPSFLMGRSSGGGGGKGGLKVVVVEELPESGETNTLYLVPKQVTKYKNVFDEYLWIDNDWEKVGTTDIDISGKQDKMQFATMPTANNDNLGKIVQYIGTTNQNYTNGYFYICVSDGQENPTYSWTNIDVQNSPYYITFYTGDTDANLKNILKPIKYISDNNLDYIVLARTSSNMSSFGICRIQRQSTTVYDLIVLIDYSDGYGVTKYGQKYYACNSCNIRLTYVDNDISTITKTIKSAATVDDANASPSSAPLASGNTEAFVPTGAYNPSTKLYVDQLIDNSNGISAYNSATSYAVGDKVYWVNNNGVYKHYTCIQAATNKAPSQTAYWQEFTYTSDEATLATKKYVSDNAGGEVHYLGSSSDYSSSNRLDITNLAYGLYTIHYDSFLYCQATINGTTYQFTLSPTSGDTPSNDIAYLEITHPITDNYASNTYIGTFNYLTVDEYYSKIRTYRLSVLYNGSGVNASSGTASVINAVNTDKTQTISGKKTFNTLPESSVVPTTDDQLVNKKYVDDIVGNISTVLATLTTPSSGGGN